MTPQAVAALLCAVAAFAVGRGAEHDDQALRQAARQVLAHQARDGALAEGVDGPVRVDPYFGDLAALGLVAAYRQFHDPTTLDAARRWILWYEQHQNPDGTIDTHDFAAGTWKSTGDYDSADSYAATYVELVDRINDTSPDAAWLAARLPSIERALDAIRAVLQPCGLTIAKRTYPVMYTMDNVETLRGLTAAAHVLAQHGSRSELAIWARDTARRMKQAIETLLWDEKTQRYLVGYQTDGGREVADGKWYPDVMANLMAVGWLPASPRRRALFARLLSEFAEQIPAKAATQDDVEHLIWWGYAAIASGDAAVTARIRRTLEEAHAVEYSNPVFPAHVCRILTGAL